MGILVIVAVLKLKNLNSILKIRNVKNRIIRPTIDATIVPRADSTAALSPPENIHLITPPEIRKNNTIITEITKIKVIAADIIPGMFVSLKQRTSNGALGHPINP